MTALQIFINVHFASVQIFPLVRFSLPNNILESMSDDATCIFYADFLQAWQKKFKLTKSRGSDACMFSLSCPSCWSLRLNTDHLSKIMIWNSLFVSLAINDFHPLAFIPAFLKFTVATVYNTAAILSIHLFTFVYLGKSRWVGTNWPLLPL